MEYDCYYNGIIMGTVEAANEDEATLAMQAKWPMLPYGGHDAEFECIAKNLETEMEDDVYMYLGKCRDKTVGAIIQAPYTPDQMKKMIEDGKLTTKFLCLDATDWCGKDSVSRILELTHCEQGELLGDRLSLVFKGADYDWGRTEPWTTVIESLFTLHARKDKEAEEESEEEATEEITSISDLYRRLGL